MDKITKFSLLFSIGLLISSCGSGEKKADSTNPSMVALSDSPVAAERKVIGEDTLVVVSLGKVPAPVTVKLTDLVDNPRIIKLDSSPEAMVGEGKIWTDGKHILIYGDQVVKLFDMDGKYIGRVGAKGNGPGEYSIAPYNIYIDDKAGRICMLQYGADQIMCYDLQGKFVENIPLAHKVNKGFVKVDFANRTATVAALLFNTDDHDNVVWTQDFQGNILSSVDKPSLALVPDFSSEVYGGFSSGSDHFNYSLFDIEGHPDTLYNYRDNALHPDFTVDFGDALAQHQYLSFPEFYIVTTFGEPKMVSEHSYIIPSNTPLLVDKKSLRVAPAELLLDNLGTLTIDNGWQFQESPDFFVLSYDPGVLLDMIEAAPSEHPLATEEGLRKMNELKSSITPDDNNYIILGPWRRSQL